MSYDPLDPAADGFGPPPISTMVGCLHCQQVYESYRIEWRVLQDNDGQPHGFWCCPIPGCDGVGFLCDIFPVDPDWRDENGEKVWMEDDETEDDLEMDEDAIPPAERGDFEAGGEEVPY